MAAYGVQFCSFATGTAGCFIVGSLMTDNGGNAEAKLQFPQHGIFAGVFVLTRNNENQFVSGFAAPMSGSVRKKTIKNKSTKEADGGIVRGLSLNNDKFLTY